MTNAIYFYKIANKLYKKRIPFIPKIIKMLIFLIYNSVVPYEASIGQNTKLGYGGIAVVIHKDCIIGGNCVISQCVTLGGRGAGLKSGKKGVPRLGNNVYVGAGAKILGDITIGDNVIIGANSVVLNNIPNNAVVAGVPGRIIKYNEEPNYEQN